MAIKIITDSASDITVSNREDLIIQLPYVIKTDARREQAEKRRQDTSRKVM